MFEFIDLKKENYELKKRCNTLENENEILQERALKKLIELIDNENKNEELLKKIDRLETKVQTLKEIIHEKDNRKRKRTI